MENNVLTTVGRLAICAYDRAWENRLLDSDAMRGKYILLTGVADPNGLNAQLLRLLVQMGIAGAILLDVDPRVSDFQSEFGADIELLVRLVDVTNADDMELVAEDIQGFLGGDKLSLVVAGAGVFAPSGALNMDTEALHKVMDVTIMGTALTFKMAMEFASEEHCVFISAGSAAALACLPGMVTYNVSKAGLQALIDTLTAEYAGTGWEFHNMVFAQVAGTQLTAWFDKLEFAKALFGRSRGARLLNRHARPEPAVRHLAIMAMGGWKAEIFRFYPIHRIALLALFPGIARPIIRRIIGNLTDKERELLAGDVKRLAEERHRVTEY